jgi:hypothetical protein
MLFVINVGWQRKKLKFTVQMMRAPYEIGEEIRGRLLKILQIKRNKTGRKSAPMLTSYTEPGPNYSTIFSLYLLHNWL